MERNTKSSRFSSVFSRINRWIIAVFLVLVSAISAAPAGQASDISGTFSGLLSGTRYGGPGIPTEPFNWAPMTGTFFVSSPQDAQPISVSDGVADFALNFVKVSFTSWAVTDSDETGEGTIGEMFLDDDGQTQSVRFYPNAGNSRGGLIMTFYSGEGGLFTNLDPATLNFANITKATAEFSFLFQYGYDATSTLQRITLNGVTTTFPSAVPLIPSWVMMLTGVAVLGTGKFVLRRSPTGL